MLIQFKWFLLVLLMSTFLTSWATVEHIWLKELELGQNVTGKVEKEHNARTLVHCSIM